MYLRQMEPDDLDILLDMALMEGWSSEMLEFELNLRLNPDGCFVCIEDRNVVGGVMSFSYPASGWIGNLVVERKFRLKGFGKALFRRAIRSLTHLPTQYLCASPMAVGLYAKFGFEKVMDVYRWECRDKMCIPCKQEADIQYILDMDRKFWAEDRSRMLTPLLKARSYFAQEGACIGFKRVGDHWTIGPWEADDNVSAADILERSLVEGKKQRIILDVPAHNTGAWYILNKMGFQVVGKAVLMCRGKRPDIAYDNIYGFASMGSKG